MIDLLTRLRSCNVLIGYTPLSGEPNASNFLEEHSLMSFSEVVPPDKRADPFSMAEEWSKRYERSDVCVFLPGTQFDTQGNRRGRGGGWYDRFLSRIPKVWVRVGVTDVSNVVTSLSPQPWDEPVDFLLIHDGTWSYRHTSARLQDE